MQKQKNVLMLSYIDYPYYIGLSRRISGVSKALIANNINVKVISPRVRSQVVLDDDFSDHILVKRIDLRYLGSEANYGSKLIQWILFSLLSSIEVIKDVIKRRSIVQYQSIYSAFPAIVAKIIMYATVIGDDVILINPIIDKVVLRLTDCISTPSITAYSYARQLGKTAFYVPNGVDTNTLKYELKDSKNFLNLIFVGTLTFNQNFEAVKNIIKIASALDKEILNFTIFIVGGPISLATELMNNPVVQKGRVKFLGQLSFGKLSELYTSATIGLLPFFQDIPLKGGQRTKALEFLANGLLVVSGPEGVQGIDGLKKGAHFLMTTSLDEMCETLKEYLMYPEKYLAISRNGLTFVNDNYSWLNLTRKYIDYLKNLEC